MNRFTEILPDNRLLVVGALNACDIVCSTMGPHGRSVAVVQGSTVATSKDGVNVAANIHFEDLAENAGAQMALDGCQKTVDEVGDGTTTTAAIVRELLRKYEEVRNDAAHVSTDRSLCEELKVLSDQAAKYLKDNATPVDADDKEMLTAIAATSLNNDWEIGAMVAEAAMETGANGQMIIKDDPASNEITYEVRTGYTWDKGPSSLHYFERDGLPYINIDNPVFVLSEDGINDQKHLINVMSVFRDKYGKHIGNARDGSPVFDYTRHLVIIAPGISGSALEFLLKQTLKAGMPVTSISSSSFECLQDVSKITGAPIFSEATSTPIRSYEYKKGIQSKSNKLPFGTANSVVITKNQSTILFDRTDEIIEYAKNVEDRTRRARLESGIAYFKVGANTDTSMRNIGQLIEDAKCAVYSAMKDGYIPGGGYLLANFFPATTNEAAAKVFTAGIKGPARTILSNADIDVKGDKLNKYLTGNYNARTGNYDESDFMVYDAVQSSISSVKNAVSVFSNIITVKHISKWKQRSN